MNGADSVLDILYEREGAFVRPDELAAAVSVTRERLNDILASLCGEGFSIDASPAHGVRLVRPAPLNAHLIERQLGTRRVGRHAICFGQVASTSDVAFDSARQADADGLVVLAEYQRKGRGRMGRRWLSPPGKNLLMSVLLVESDRVLPYEALTIAADLSVAQGLEAACGVACRIKWPNDVTLDGEKLAGVLVERRLLGGASTTVVGIGVNLGASPPRDAVDAPATNLALHTDDPIERVELARAILRRLDDAIERIASCRLDEIHDAWMSRCGMVHQRLRVQCKGLTYVGTVLDVSPLEGLVLSCDDGRHVHLPAESSTVVL